jgi:MFS family permease
MTSDPREEHRAGEQILELGPASPVIRNAAVLGIASASLLSDAGHEMATAVLPGFLRSLGAPALALGAVEAAADAAQSFSKLAGGVVADRASERKRVAAAGYVTTALGTGGFALAGPWPVVAFFRAVAWSARGLRSPARDSLLAGAVPAPQRGRAFGLERAGDSIGAVIGPLLAALLLGIVGFRGIFLLSVIPGLLAAVAIWRLVRETPRIPIREAKVSLQGLPHGAFRRLAVAYGLYGLGNFAPTLLVLRATDLLHPGRTLTSAAALAVLLYSIHNAANAVAAYPAGAVADRIGHRSVLAAGFALFGLGCVGFAVWEPRSFAVLAALFAAVGTSTAMVETARGAYVADLVEPAAQGRAYGVLGLIDGLGDLVANLAVGLLFTVASAGWGFAWGAFLSLVAGAILFMRQGPVRSRAAESAKP